MSTKAVMTMEEALAAYRAEEMRQAQEEKKARARKDAERQKILALLEEERIPEWFLEHEHVYLPDWMTVEVQDLACDEVRVRWYFRILLEVWHGSQRVGTVSHIKQWLLDEEGNVGPNLYPLACSHPWRSSCDRGGKVINFPRFVEAVAFATGQER